MRLVTGISAPVFGFVATKWLIRWSAGDLPVAIVVHRIGDSIGSQLASRPYAPSRRSFAKFGSWPSESSRSTVSGSTPSRPSTITRARDGEPWQFARRTGARYAARTAKRNQIVRTFDRCGTARSVGDGDRSITLLTVIPLTRAPARA